MKKEPAVVTVNVKNDEFDHQWALQSLRVGRRWYRRSWVRGIVGGLISAALYTIMFHFGDTLNGVGVLPNKGSPIPTIIASFLGFMVAGASGLLMAAARFYSQRAKEAFTQLIASQEALTTIICMEVDDRDKRKKGLNILKFLFWTLMLHASDIQFRVTGVSRGTKNCWDLLLARLGHFAKQNGIGSSLITSSAGLIRLTMGRNLMNMVVRFGLRLGLIVMAVTYFVVLLLLIMFDLWSNHDLNFWFEIAMVSIISFLMTTLIFASYNESKPLLEMGGKGQYGLADRLNRICIKIDDQERETAELFAAKTALTLAQQCRSFRQDVIVTSTLLPSGLEFQAQTMQRT